MDLLDCQTRSRCASCHHFDARTGCELLNALAAFESSIAPRAPPTAPALSWADTRSFTLAEA